MKCVLLCAGFGTRLAPLTDDTPKPLLDVGGRPLLDDLMDRCVHDAGLRDFVLVSNGRFARRFEDWWAGAAPRWPGVTLDVIDDGARTNETRLGAVRDLQLAIERSAASGPLFVAAADNLVRFDLAAFLDDFRARPRNLILTYEEPDLAARQRSGVAEVDAAGRVLRFVEKSEAPPGRRVSPPFYVFCDDALAEIPRLLEAEPDVDAPGGLVAWLAPRVVVEHHAMRGRRHDIGHLESYHAACALVAAERTGDG
jgi:glucose-1-phosphate thymidylyltransferase